MKAGSGKRKGGAFERLICKKLSLWWTHGKRDDVFFRTASSGGRATQRAKKGKKTFGQYGDIQAADPIGQPLIDTCVIECKDGYGAASVFDLIDSGERNNPKYAQFIEQAEKSQVESGSRYWLLIARRRGRQIIAYMPSPMFNKFLDSPWLCIPRCKVRTAGFMWFVAVPLELFLNSVQPEQFL